MKAQITELVECLEICLKNFEQDTLPRPAQIKRIRQAVADAKAAPTAEESRPKINKLNAEECHFEATPLPPAHEPRPKIDKLVVEPVPYTPLPAISTNPFKEQERQRMEQRRKGKLRSG